MVPFIKNILYKAISFFSFIFVKKEIMETNIQREEYILFKWRASHFKEFEYYSKVPVENIKNYTGPLYQSQHVQFQIEGPIPNAIHPLIKSNIITIFNVNSHLIYIDGNILYVYDPDSPVAYLEQLNITHFRIGNGGWQPITNVNLSVAPRCIVSTTPIKAITAISNRNPWVQQIDNEVITDKNLSEKPFNDLLKMIEVKDFSLMFP